MEFEVSFRETLRQLADAQVRLNSMGKVLDTNTDKSSRMASAMATAASKIRSEMSQLEKHIERNNLLREDEKRHIDDTRKAAERLFAAMAKGNLNATAKLQAFNGELGNLDRLVKDTASKQVYTRYLQRSATLSAEAAGKTKFYADKLNHLATAEGRAAVEAERLARERAKNIQQMGKEAAMADSHVRAYHRMAEAQRAARDTANSYLAIVNQLSSAEREMAVTGQKVAWGYEVLTARVAEFRAQQQAAKAAVDAHNQSMVEGVRNLERYTGANAQAEQAARSLAQQERNATSSRTAELAALRGAMQTRTAQETTYQETVRQSAAATRTLTEAEARTRAGRDAQLAGTRAYNEAMVRNAETTRIASGSLATYAAQLSRVTGSVSTGSAEKLNQQFAQMAARGREATSSLSALTKSQAQLQAAEERLIAGLQRRNDLTLAQARATSTLSSSEAKLTQRIKEQTAEYQRRAQYMQMTNAQLFGLSRSHDRISRDMHINAQAAAMFRAGLGGLNASIGIYTSATVLAASATYAIASAFRTGMSAGMEFTETMARAEAVMMTSSAAVTNAGRSMEAVTAQVRALGASTLYTSTEVAGGLVDLGMAGLSASDAMTSLAPALNLAAIGAIDMSRSADIATNVMTSFDKEASDLGNVVDIMATAITNSNTNIEQLANALSYVGPAAQAAGFELEDTTAAIELLSNAGIKASRAGTGLRRFMLNIQNPTAKGAAVLDRFGISIVNAEGQTRSMTDILGQFNRALHNDAITPAERTAAIMDLVGVRAQSAVARMISSFDQFGVLRRQLDEVSGAAEKMRETMEDVLSMDWRQLKSAFQDIQLDTFLKYEDTLRSFTAQARLSLMELQEVNEEMTNMVFSPEQIADGEMVTELDILVTKFGEAADVVKALGVGFLAFKGANVAATMLGSLSAQALSASHSMSVLNARGNLLNTTNLSLVASFRSLGGSLAAHWANVRYAASGTEMLTASLYSLATGATYAARALSLVASALGWAGLVYGVYTAVTTLFSNDTESRIRDHGDRVEAAKTKYKELQEAIERTTEARQLAALNQRASEADEEAEGLRRRIKLTEITLAQLDEESDVYVRVSDSLAMYKSALEEAESSASEAREAAGQIGVNEAQVQGMRERVGSLTELFGLTSLAIAEANKEADRLASGSATAQYAAMAADMREEVEKLSAVQHLLKFNLDSSTQATEEATKAMVDHAAAIDVVLAAQSAQLQEEYRFESLSDFEKMNELEAEKARLLKEVAQAQIKAADAGGIAADIAERMGAELAEVNEDYEKYKNAVQGTWAEVTEKQAELEAAQRNEIDTLESLRLKMNEVQAARIAMYAMSAVTGETVNPAEVLELQEQLLDLQNRMNTVTNKGTKDSGKSANQELEQMLRTFRQLRDEYDPVTSATEEYNKQLGEMDKLLKLGKISTDDHAAAKAHLTDEYKKSINPLTEIRDILDPIGQLTEEYEEKVEELNAAVALGTITWLEAAEAQMIYAAELGKGKDAIDPYAKRTKELLDQYGEVDDIVKTRKAISDLNERLRDDSLPDDTRRNLVRAREAAEEELRELVYQSDDAAQEIRRSWDQAMESIDTAFVDGIEGMLDRSKNVFENFSDAMIDGTKRMVAEMIYQAALKPVVVQITTAMGSSLGIPGVGGQQGAQQGGLSLDSLNVNTLRQGWETASGWFGGGTTAGGFAAQVGGTGSYSGWAGSATGTGYGPATGAAASTAYGAPSWAGGGTAAGGLVGGAYTAGAGMAGSYLGGEVFGGEGDSDTGAAIGSAAGAVIGSYIPVIGTYLGSAIGGFLGSGIGSLFGNETEFKGRFGTTGTADPSQYASSGKDGVFEHQDDGTNFYGQSALGYTGFLDSGTERLQRAGIGEDKGWAEELTAASVQMDNLVASIASSPAELEAMRSAVQGLETSSSNAGQIIEFALNERPRAALEALGGDFGAFVRILDGGIEQVVAQAQVAQQAHTLLTDSAERLGLQFNIAGGYAYEAAQEVAQLAGGVENLSSLQQSYYQNYFSDAERAAHLTEDLTETLNSMGLQMPETREGFRALIESQELATQAGRENYTQLLQLESAFAQLTPAIEETGSAAIDASDALREREQLEKQLLQAQGNTDALRQLELDRLSELETAEVNNLTTLQRRIYAIEDERAAQEAAERAQQERIRAIEQESQAWARARDQLAGFSNSIDGWLAQLDGTEKGMGTPRERLEASDADFWAQYEKALQGDRNAQQGITQSADRYIANLQEMYASSDPAVDGIAEIRDAMERLPEMLTPEQFLADEFKNALGEQTVSLTNVLDLNGDGTISAIERSITAEWDATQQLNGVLSSEMELLGTTVLTESQIRSALKPHATDAEINRLINNVDKNGDGIISRQELTNARLSDLAGGIAGALEPMFSSIDLDANELIDYNEFGKAFEGMATDGELRRIFNKLDVDGNGQISRLEAINANTSTIDQANGDGLKVSFGRNHNPSGLIDMAYNWGTKWGQMGAPAFRGAGGGDLDYEPPGETSGGSGSGGSSSGGGSAGGSSSGGSGTSGIPAGAQSWIDQFSANEPNSVQFLSVDYLLKHWRNHDTEIRKTGQALYELEALGARMPSGDTTLRNLTPSWKFFANGGYTGPGGKYDPAGIVHAGEVVWSQADIARAGGVGAVESMRIGGISAPPLPKIQMQLPMPEMPPLPQFPALSNNDVLQVLNDVRKELQETRKENKRLLELIGENTGDTVAAVEQAAARSEQQRDDQLDELETLSRYSKTEIRTT